MRRRLPLGKFLRIAGLTPLVVVLAAGLLANSARAATEGKAVQTETIIVPSGTIDEGLPADEAAPPPEPQPPAAALPEMPVPEVGYDPAELPVPVARLREQIIEAAASGDAQKLQPIIDANGEPPAFSVNPIDAPVAYLKSNYDEGRELLAVLIEVLEAGYVHVHAGTPDDMYVWPYFAFYPVDKLDPKQMVELFKLVYAGDFEDMKTYGTYLYYRVGITPGGQWKFFLANE